MTTENQYNIAYFLDSLKKSIYEERKIVIRKIEKEASIASGYFLHKKRKIKFKIIFGYSFINCTIKGFYENNILCDTILKHINSPYIKAINKTLLGKEITYIWRSNKKGLKNELFSLQWEYAEKGFNPFGWISTEIIYPKK